MKKQSGTANILKNTIRKLNPKQLINFYQTNPRIITAFNPNNMKTFES